MQSVNIDIIHVTKSIATEGRFAFIEKIKLFFERRIEAIAKKHCKDLDVVNLALHGILDEIETLSPEEAKKVLGQTKIVISKLIKKDEILRDVKYLDNQLLKHKFKNMLKKMYKIEATLDTIVHKDVKVLKTDKEISDGIRSMNSKHISNLLAD